MSDTEQTVDPSAPDANASLESDAPDGARKTGSEAAPSPAGPAADDVTEKVRSRFDELTRFRREAERDRDHWRELAMRAQPAPPTPEKTDAKLKTLAEFNYDEAAHSEYLFQHAEQRAIAAADRRLREQQEQESAQRRRQAFSQREREFAKSIPDYYEKTRSDAVDISRAMAEVAQESEEGPAVLLHLANNPVLAAQLAQLPPLAAAREMGRLEAKLIADRERIATEKKRVSEAPPPPPKVEGTEPSTRVSTTSPESDKLSDDEWVKAENARLARKAKKTA